MNKDDDEIRIASRHPDQISIFINKDYLQKIFEKVFEKWKNRLQFGISLEDQKDLLNDFINAI